MAYSTAAETIVPVGAPKSHPLSGSFRKNMALPVHRWFRYSAGFSAAWAEREIEARQDKQDVRVYDPFAGSGTTLIAAQRVGADARGIESHPFVARVAKAKLRWGADIEVLTARAESVVKLAGRGALPDPLPDLLGKIFEREHLRRLLGLREALLLVSEQDEVDELLWLALVAILRACSPAGTAQWQYVLPNKTKLRVANPVDAFQAQVAHMAMDMRFMQALPSVGDARVEVADARDTSRIPDGWANLVVTSPPYPNNFDYADATRIEMTFLGEIASWGELQGTVRRHLIRSCSQHMARYDATAVLEDELLKPIGEELRDVYEQLDAVRKGKGGRKAYHSMVVAYFHDLAACWHSLRQVVADGGEVLFVIGDSAPYGVHLPVERWLGELALAAGFEDYTFTKLRDRNISPLWRSRRHAVRLHEGILRVAG
jgi:hypothetical protein